MRIASGYVIKFDIKVESDIVKATGMLKPFGFNT